MQNSKISTINPSSVELIREVSLSDCRHILQLLDSIFSGGHLKLNFNLFVYVLCLTMSSSESIYQKNIHL